MVSELSNTEQKKWSNIEKHERCIWQDNTVKYRLLPVVLFYWEQMSLWIICQRIYVLWPAISNRSNLQISVNINSVPMTISFMIFTTTRRASLWSKSILSRSFSTTFAFALAVTVMTYIRFHKGYCFTIWRAKRKKVLSLRKPPWGYGGITDKWIVGDIMHC